MKIKKFIAKTPAEAMKMAKEEFGEDVAILKTTKKKGKVELLVAIDTENETVETSFAKQINSHPISSSLGNDASLLGIMLGGNKFKIEGDDLLRLYLGLVDKGKKIRDDLKKKLIKLINCAPSLSVSGNKKIFLVFVGPPGGGKTTTLCKIAFMHKDQKPAIFSTDLYRLGAINQLEKFSEISNSDLYKIYNTNDLKEALEKTKKNNLILVDTPGISLNDKERLKQTKKIIDYLQPDEIHLILPSIMQSVSIVKTINYFNYFQLNRILLTKMDEMISFESILTIIGRANIPFSYFTNGQNIQSDISHSNPESLVDIILDSNAAHMMLYSKINKKGI